MGNCNTFLIYLRAAEAQALKEQLDVDGRTGMYGISAPDGGQDSVDRLFTGSLVLTGVTCGAAGDEAGTSGAAGEAEDRFCF